MTTVNDEQWSQIKEAAHHAAAWWADRLRAPTGAAGVGDRQVDGLVGDVRAVVAPALAPDETTIDDFAETLRMMIRADLFELIRAGAGALVVTLRVDYRAEGRLAEAVKTAGIERAILPFKTEMLVSPERVVVSEGHGARHVQLWPRRSKPPA